MDVFGDANGAKETKEVLADENELIVVEKTAEPIEEPIEEQMRASMEDLIEEPDVDKQLSKEQLLLARTPRIGGVDRTSEAGVFFEVFELKIGTHPIIAGGVDVQDVSLAGSDGVLKIPKGNASFELEAKWGATNTAGWVAGDYLIFPLPLAEYVAYVGGSGGLNNGYGIWEVSATDKTVKLTLSETAISGGSNLQDGTFKTRAQINVQKTFDEEGQLRVGDVDINFKINAEWTGLGEGLDPKPDMTKGAKMYSGNTIGQYYFWVNATSYAKWFKEKVNDENYVGYEKSNVVIVDELPEGIELQGDGEFGLAILLKGPTVNEHGDVVQGANEEHSVDIDINQVMPEAGESYETFYGKVIAAQAPSLGVYNDRIIILNLGNLPTDNTFLDIYNERGKHLSNKHPNKEYHSMEAYLKENLESTKYETIPNITGVERAGNWLSLAGNVYKDDMKVWDYVFTMSTVANWRAADLDLPTKKIENKAIMTYDEGEVKESSIATTYHRTVASIQVSPGELFILKADSESQAPIAGVKLKIQRYMGDETTIEGVRQDNTTGVWAEISDSELTTDAGGSGRWQGLNDRFYKISEVMAASGYDIGSFELFSIGASVGYKDGIFEMPQDLGLKLVAENTKSTPPPTPIVTVTPMPTPIVTVTPTPTPIVTVTPTPTPIVTVTLTPTPIVTVTPMPTPIVTMTPTPIVTVTSTPKLTHPPKPNIFKQTPSKGGNVNTGDTNEIVRILGVIVISLGVIIILVGRRRRRS